MNFVVPSMIFNRERKVDFEALKTADEEDLFEGIPHLTAKEQEMLMVERYSRRLNELCGEITAARVKNLFDLLAKNPDMTDEMANMLQMQEFSPILQKMYEDEAFRNAMISAYATYNKEAERVERMAKRDEWEKAKANPELTRYYTSKKVLPGFEPIEYREWIQNPDVVNVLSKREGYSGDFYSVYFDRQKDIDFFEVVREGRQKGRPIDDIVETLSKKWNESIEDSKIDNVVRTEISRARSEGSVLADKKSGFIVAYIFRSNRDGRTTVYCSSRSGRMVDVENQTILDQCKPPLHYRCRSYLVPLSADDVTARGGYKKLQEDTLYLQSCPNFSWH